MRLFSSYGFLMLWLSTLGVINSFHVDVSLRTTLFQHRTAATTRTRRASFVLYSSSSIPLDGKPSGDATSSSSSEENKSLDMPWSQLQDWALRDQLPKYTVVIPIEDEDGVTKHKSYTLWRTMSREVIELAGYPIDFLQQRQVHQIQNNETKLTTPTGALPYLDDFEFSNSGGLSGIVYGVRGVADGTRIETAPVGNVQRTIPSGFVLTSDGSVAYELGTPLREDDFVYSLDGTNTRKIIKQTADQVGGAISTSVSTAANSVEDPDAMLVRLGGLTTIVLAGAVAVNMLSHHLTVNVFWV